MSINNDNNEVKGKSDKLQISNNENDIYSVIKPIKQRTVTQKLEILILFGFVIITTIYFILKYIESTIPDCSTSITFG